MYSYLCKCLVNHKAPRRACLLAPIVQYKSVSEDLISALTRTLWPTLTQLWPWQSSTTFTPTIALVSPLLQKKITPKCIQQPHLGKFQSWHWYQPPCVHLRRGRLRKKGSILGTRIQHVLNHLPLAPVPVLKNQHLWLPRVPSPLLIWLYHPEAPPFDFQKLPLVPCLLPRNDDIFRGGLKKSVNSTNGIHMHPQYQTQQSAYLESLSSSGGGGLFRFRGQ